MKCGGSKQAEEDISSCKQAASCGNHHLWVGVRNWCGFGNVLEAFVEETHMLKSMTQEIPSHNLCRWLIILGRLIML